MDSHINTSGGHVIGGNVNTSGGDVVGRDQHNIQNIIVVGRFLELAQVEGLLPKIGNKENFSSATEAIEKALGARLNNDLVEATAFAGGILSDILNEWMPEASRGGPILLKSFIIFLVNHIGHKLDETGYWQAFNQSVNNFDNVLWLEATMMLWEKQFSRKESKHIFVRYNSDSSITYTLYISYDTDLTRFSPKQLRIVIAGIVLDLIRIYSDNQITIQLLQELADLFKSSSSSAQS